MKSASNFIPPFVFLIVLSVVMFISRAEGPLLSLALSVALFFGVLIVPGLNLVLKFCLSVGAALLSYRLMQQMRPELATMTNAVYIVLNVWIMGRIFAYIPSVVRNPLALLAGLVIATTTYFVSHHFGLPVWATASISGILFTFGYYLFAVEKESFFWGGKL